jgi:effector-binding domain-containing protein
MVKKSLLTMLWLTAALLGCGDHASPKEPATAADKLGDTVGKATQSPAPPAATVKPPIINLLDTVSVAKWVLYMTDSAATIERVGLKLGEIYGPKLGKCLATNKLTMTGPPMAWYKSEKAPYFFEAGVPVDKKPAQLPKGVQLREIPAGPVLIARFFGPYDMMGIGYEAAKERLKSTKTASAGAPYEVYVGDPVVMKDPYKVQTDIVFPVKPAQQ